MNPDNYCSACDICYYEPKCPSCGGPWRRKCKRCGRRMYFDGKEPPWDMMCMPCAEETMEEADAR